MLKILHFSDAHLDVPHTAADLDAAEVRRAELRSAFSSMMLYIRQNGVRLVLIAGDLFDHAFLTRETTSLLVREFASVPDCHFVISPGNRDYYAEDSVWAKTAFSKNVHIFRSPTPACFPLDDIGVQVWGFAHVSPDMGSYAPLAHLELAEKPANLRRIFCGHAAVVSEGTALPPELTESGTPPTVTKEQLSRLGFDYAALGYAHTSDGIRRVGSSGASTGSGAGKWTYFGYSGCLVGRGYDECGARGAVCGTFADDGSFSVRRLRIAKRHYEVLCIDFTDSGVKSTADVQTVLRHATEEAAENGIRLDADAMVRVECTGALPPDVRVTNEALTAAIPGTAGMELCDRTTAAAEHTLSADATLRGAYYRELAAALADKDEDMRIVAGEALRAGLAAMKTQR